MFSGKQLRLYLASLFAWGCASATSPPEGVLRFAPESIPRSFAGPMPHFGPFDSRWDALLAACPLILSQRGATAGRRDGATFDVYWRVSTEYCAWVYYTPDDKYEMSMLVEDTETIPPDNQGERRCRLPVFVDDKRYPPQSLRYIYLVHNHPEFPTNISKLDIAGIIKAARFHGAFAETKEGRIPLGVVAFFSSSRDPSSATCDGFFEYSLGNRTEVLKWTHDERGDWHKEKAGTVTWFDDTKFRFEQIQTGSGQE